MPSVEQRAFAAALHELLTKADLATISAAWADGDTGPGRRLWAAFGDLGVTGLMIDGGPDDLVVAAEELGHHAVPGPVAESIAAAPLLAGEDLLPELAAGRIIVSLAVPPWLPLAADGDSADLILHVTDAGIRAAEPGAVHRSLHPARRLAEVRPGALLATGRPVRRALELGVLACAAQLLGAGRALLETSVEYARTRTQFGTPIGSFQAVQHRLADVSVALTFARPLLHAAAVTLRTEDVSAAKVACGEAAVLAARAALQVHGAIGYTRELDLNRWLTLVPVLHRSWGTAGQHRDRILQEIR
ncbi:acyl-CoA dehydrogenase family protein [Actinoplanes couchii]|uniref:Acyl-CoA dehydrogenase n=1 Tax=Actinoplanes couchii TaxID=403638 RepID=A0ABQ3XF63_9ACTN|nr:acyl-CoA dehydrogenase [Actinoplanes couchii]